MMLLYWAKSKDTECNYKATISYRRPQSPCIHLWCPGWHIYYLQLPVVWMDLLSWLVVDGHLSQASPIVRWFCDQVGTTLRVLDTGTPWGNRAELYIGLLKEAVRRDMRHSKSPMTLWCYCIEQRAKIQNAITRPLFHTEGRSPHVFTFGVQGDISIICNFRWYEWIYYHDSGSFPENKEKLGRVLGPTVN